MKFFAFFSLLIVSFFLNYNIQAQDLMLASIFGDHMVIQQGINAAIWGTAGPDVNVKVELAGYVSSSKTGADGNWMLRMPVLDAGGLYEMKITGNETIILKDAMIGEVWLSSGQSNMEWTMGSGVGSNTDSDIAIADIPAIRYFSVPPKNKLRTFKRYGEPNLDCVYSRFGEESFCSVLFFYQRAKQKQECGSRNNKFILGCYQR
jgi:sialate O-acetylesterase